MWIAPSGQTSSPQVFETLGDSGMVGNSSDGLWVAAPTAFDQQLVVRMGPASGVLSTDVTLRARYSGSAKHLYLSYLSPLTSWRGVTLAGSFFLLDPPVPPLSGKGTAGRFSALYRITPVAEQLDRMDDYLKELQQQGERQCSRVGAVWRPSSPSTCWRPTE